MGQEIQLKLNNNNVSPTVEKVGDGNLQGFTATDLTGAANELKNTLNHKADVIYDTASGDIASFPDGADGLPVKDLTVAIEPVQDISGGDPSPTHICPISGWTGANVSRTGKNLLNADNLININGANNVFVKNGGAYVFTKIGSEIANRSSSEAPILIKKGTVFTFSYKCTYSTAPESPGNVRFLLRDGTYYTALSSSNWSDVSITITAPDDMVAVQIYYSSGSTGVGSVVNISDVQIELGSTVSAYEAYQGTTLPISWQSEAGTVYGGTLDVTSGVLTVDRASVDLGTVDWTLEDGLFWTIMSNRGPYAVGICSYYPFYANETWANLVNSMPDKSIATTKFSSQRYTVIRDSGYATGADLKAALSGTLFVYELAQPQTYQLTPTEVITTLLGQNNIWADCGPSTVEYPCDTKLYIQKINTPTDDDMIADANIASGQYFIVNNNLYLSTAAILAGDPIKPGTNCTLTNLAAALNAINS